MADMLVLGSLNTDFSLIVPELPIPGATVVGGALAETSGGKGANQAVAAARLGGKVRLIGRVGADERGGRLLRELADEGIDATRVAMDRSSPTGAGLIVVDKHGENMIAVAPGANASVDANHVLAAITAGRPDILLCQLEIPLETVSIAVSHAQRLGIPVVLNAAPAVPAARTLAATVDVLVVNREEAEIVFDRAVPDVRAALDLASACAGAGRTVVITLGPDGVVAAAAGECWHRPADIVDAVDTVGAGDTFVGALSLALAEGVCLRDAVDLAASAAALTVRFRGAREGMPTRAALTEYRAGSGRTTPEVRSAR